MKKWLIQETGEVRLPKMNEQFFDTVRNLIDFAEIDFHNEKCPILSITEITEEATPLTDNFSEWNW